MRNAHFEDYSRITRHASRITPHASRLTPHASRLTPHASRLTPHASRLTHHASHQQLDHLKLNPEHFSSPDALALAAADAWLDEIEAAARTGRPYCVALSGGRIAENFFTATVARATARKTSFAQVHFFWADERCVPPTDPASNYKLAYDCLLAPLKIVTDRIHRLRGEDIPQVAAKHADNELQSVALKHDNQPVLDLIVLGMGEDGHVASLFPNAIDENVDISASFFVVSNSPKPPPVRISLSYRAIFAAKQVWVLVSGAGKAAVLRDAMSGKQTIPLGRIIATRGVKIFNLMNEF